MLSGYDIPTEFAGRLRIGTCSWKYDSWKGLVYEPDRRYRPDDYLPDYARQPRGAARRANEPNPYFLSVDLLSRFLETLGPMHSRLGPIMFQFEYLNRQKMPSPAAFLERLHAFFQAAPAGFPYAVETRNPNYLKDEFFDFLRQRSLGYVLLDGYYMPRIAEVAARWDTHTAPFSIIRLLGTDRAEIEERTGGTWDKIAEPKDGGLQATADMIRQNVEFGVDTYVNVNNHYEGSAPLTIQRLLNILQQSRSGRPDPDRGHR